MDNQVALVVALVGTAGLGGFAREIISGVQKLRSGVSAKESGRKRDLVNERDYEFDRAEAEARNRRRTEEALSKHRRIMHEHGLTDLMPEWPKLEEIPDRCLRRHVVLPA